MKPQGFNKFSQHLNGYHIDEIRAQANRDRLRGEDFVEEYEEMQKMERVRPGEDMIEEFHTVVGQQDKALDMAFDVYLRSGVVTPVMYREEDVFQKAMLHVTRAYPTLDMHKIRAKAEEMLHNLNLDDCHGRYLF